ncbi:hypothetical protein GCM10027341_53780 [Spirosoma knui]
MPLEPLKKKLNMTSIPQMRQINLDASAFLSDVTNAIEANKGVSCHNHSNGSIKESAPPADSRTIRPNPPPSERPAVIAFHNVSDEP